MSGITYAGLFAGFRKGLRNGNWKHLNRLDNALFRASLWYAKPRGSIVNALLVEKQLALVEKLKETNDMKIFKAGFKKAVEMFGKNEDCGIFKWMSQLKQCLRDIGYIFWLGAMR